MHRLLEKKQALLARKAVCHPAPGGLAQPLHALLWRPPIQGPGGSHASIRLMHRCHHPQARTRDPHPQHILSDTAASASGAAGVRTDWQVLAAWVKEQQKLRGSITKALFNTQLENIFHSRPQLLLHRRVQTMTCQPPQLPAYLHMNLSFGLQGLC